MSDRDWRRARSIHRLATKRASLAVGQPRSLASVMAAIESVRALLVEKADESPPRFPLACGPGCAYCCHAFVEVLPAEVAAIVDYLRTQVPPALAADLTLKIATTDERTRGMTPTARTDAVIPCPLLVDGSCSVYAVRPLKCRGYSSYDRETCRADWDGSAPNGVGVYHWQYVLADALVAALDKATARAGLESMGLDLVAALCLALEDESTIGRWLAGERAFDVARTASQ